MQVGVLQSMQVGVPQRHKTPDTKSGSGTTSLINDFGHSRNKDVEIAKALACCPLLEEWWQKLVVRQAMRKKPMNDTS
jgi:hypothetical protein